MDIPFDQVAKVVPEVKSLYWERMEILQTVSRFGPIGRKALTERMKGKERFVRKEMDLLKNQGLLDSTRRGVVLTEEGRKVVALSSSYRYEEWHYKEKGRAIARKYGLKDVIIVDGDYNQNPNVIFEMGTCLQLVLDDYLPTGESTIALSGGSTIRHLVDELYPVSPTPYRSLQVIPARGGMRDALPIQANTIADALARKLHGKAKPLYLPESLKSETFDSLLKDPYVKDFLYLLIRSKVVIYSIGEALKLAERRGLSNEEKQLLKEREAVGEALGAFFNKDGEIVYRVPQIGLQIEQLSRISHPICVIAGSKKQEILKAYLKRAPHQLTLIADEGALNTVFHGDVSI